MALNNTRSTGGGRKPIVIPNPFVVLDELGNEDNVLWGTEDELDQCIEDILIGCVRAFTAEVEGATNFVDWNKLLRIYRNVWELTALSIQNYLHCSRATSNKYIKVIKFTNTFIKRYIDGKSGGNTKGYIDIHKRQIKSGYLRIL